MWQGYIFGVHWRHEGKMYYDELPADSKEAAAGYFIDHKRDDVSLVRVEMVGPNEGGVREFAHSPDSPFTPLMARRRLDVDDDVKCTRWEATREGRQAVSPRPWLFAGINSLKSPSPPRTAPCE